MCGLLILCAGYVKGNVWIVSRRANTIKNDATFEEFELIARNLRARIELMPQPALSHYQHFKQAREQGVLFSDVRGVAPIVPAPLRVGFHAVGALAPGNMRLTLLYNVVLVRDLDFSRLPMSNSVNTWPALQVPQQVHDDLFALARDLVPHPHSGTIMSHISHNAQSRISGNA